jgi:hypothetical protein
MFAERRIVLGRINEFMRKGGLADQGMFLHLPALIQSKRRLHEEPRSVFRRLQPRILAGLLNAVAGGRRGLPSMRPAELLRITDFARFGEAVGR